MVDLTLGCLASTDWWVSSHVHAKAQTIFVQLLSKRVSTCTFLFSHSEITPDIPTMAFLSCWNQTSPSLPMTNSTIDLISSRTAFVSYVHKSITSRSLAKSSIIQLASWSLPMGNYSLKMIGWTCKTWNTGSWINMMLRACLVIQLLLQTMRQYFTWFGPMSLRHLTEGRKLNVFATDHPGWGLSKFLMRRMQIALIRQVHAYSMQLLGQKISLSLVQISQMHLLRPLNWNKASLYDWIGPSTNGGLSIKDFHPSQLVTSSLYSLPCKATPYCHDFGRSTPMLSYANLVSLPLSMNPASTQDS